MKQGLSFETGPVLYFVSDIPGMNNQLSVTQSDRSRLLAALTDVIGSQVNVSLLFPSFILKRAGCFCTNPSMLVNAFDL